MTIKEKLTFIHPVFSECLLITYHYKKREYIKKNIKNVLIQGD